MFMWHTHRPQSSAEGRKGRNQGWNMEAGTMRSATCQLAFWLTLSQASCLASFRLQLRTSSPRDGIAFRGLGPPTSIDNQENGSQTNSQTLKKNDN